jgi:hypothetical protein
MKRIIFGILVLVCAWQLVQLPAINAMLFAFLALGINPLTNLPFSTPSLISILIILAFVSVFLLFNKALTDFFGGLSDWLAQIDRSLEVAVEPESEPKPGNATAPVVTNDVLGIEQPVTARLTTMAASARSLPLLTVRLPHWRPYATRMAEWYQARVTQARQHLRAARQVTLTEAPEPVSTKSATKATLVPELAEVVAIFEKLALEQIGPPEAEVVAKKASSRVKKHVLGNPLARLRAAWGLTGHTVVRSTVHVSVSTSSAVKATEQRVGLAVQAMVRAAACGVVAMYMFLYRGILLLTLGTLLVGGLSIHWLQVSAQLVARTIRSVYRRACQLFVMCGVTITLALFAIGRGIAAVFQSIGHGLAAVSRRIYWLLANVVKIALLAAGYSLFIFSLLCFMIWEVCEPYARRVDKWLAKAVDERDGYTEMSKVAHEMTRTFMQWYRQLRDIKHSIYH